MASPISASLDIEKKRSHVITVINGSKTKTVPVNIRTASWSLSDTGKEIQTQTKDLMVFPRQMILKPGQQRSVRVATRYKKKQRVEQSYRVIVEELPINLKKSGQQSGVNILLAYITAFYVLPTEPKSSLQFLNLTKKNNGLAFTFSNQGNAHTHLREMKLTISQGGQSMVFTKDDELKDIKGENILAKHQRHFFWQWPANVAKQFNLKKPLKVNIELECEYCSSTILNFQSVVP